MAHRRKARRKTPYQPASRSLAQRRRGKRPAAGDPTEATSAAPAAIRTGRHLGSKPQNRLTLHAGEFADKRVGFWVFHVVRHRRDAFAPYTNTRIYPPALLGRALPKQGCEPGAEGFHRLRASKNGRRPQMLLYYNRRLPAEKVATSKALRLSLRLCRSRKAHGLQLSPLPYLSYRQTRIDTLPGF